MGFRSSWLEFSFNFTFHPDYSTLRTLMIKLESVLCYLADVTPISKIECCLTFFTFSQKVKRLPAQRSASCSLCDFFPPFIKAKNTNEQNKVFSDSADLHFFFRRTRTPTFSCGLRRLPRWCWKSSKPSKLVSPVLFTATSV